MALWGSHSSRGIKTLDNKQVNIDYIRYCRHNGKMWGMVGAEVRKWQKSSLLRWHLNRDLEMGELIPQIHGETFQAQNKEKLVCGVSHQQPGSLCAGLSEWGWERQKVHQRGCMRFPIILHPVIFMGLYYVPRLLKTLELGIRIQESSVLKASKFH